MTRRTVLRWEEPPAPSNVGGYRPRPKRYEEIAAQLRARPGQWAFISEQVSSGAKAFMQRNGLPPGMFEIAIRRPSDGPKRYRFYARYIGESS